jgi:hypothetical protein
MHTNIFTGRESNLHSTNISTLMMKCHRAYKVTVGTGFAILHFVVAPAKPPVGVYFLSIVLFTFNRKT